MADIRKRVESFRFDPYDEFFIAKNELGTISPTPKYPVTHVIVQGLTEDDLEDKRELLLESLGNWFERASIPLVGEEAAVHLREALKTKEGKHFLYEAWKSRLKKARDEERP
jgi:hypothetical protein